MSKSATTRRTVMITAGVTALSLGGGPLLARGADKDEWIDAHSHVWSQDTERFPLANKQTKKDLDPPTFTDDELMKIAEPEGVTRVVLIQHSIYHLFDNSYLLDTVRRHPRRFRAVGMLDDHGPEPAAKMKGLLKQGVTGFRITPFIRKSEPQKWLTTPGMNAMWKMAATTGQTMCCLINASDLPAVDKTCEKHPETPVVIDHFARIGSDGEMREKDVAELCKLARHKHTTVKVSAFYALGKKQPPHLELAPMIKRVYEAFGPQRLMWASDCPYQLTKGNTYHDSIALVRDKLDFLSADDRQWMLRKTAEKVFFFA
jgi:predicted TIM-barrel fold metal-dependent hydrolase